MTDDYPQPPLAEAMEWVSRILAVVAVMIVPGLAGQWLDGRWGTQFLGLIGFVGGLVAGMAYLIWLVGRIKKKK